MYKMNRIFQYSPSFDAYVRLLESTWNFVIALAESQTNSDENGRDTNEYFWITNTKENASRVLLTV